MTQLVQSACPGCKNVLHPRRMAPSADPLQALRVGHAGQATGRSRATGGGHAACSYQANTVPATRKAPAPVARLVTPTAGTAAAAPVAIPLTKAPAAIPISQRPVSSPFSKLDPTEEAAAPRTARRRRSSGGWWKGPVLGLAVLVIAAILTVALWDKIVALVPPDEDSVAQNDKGEDLLAKAPTPKHETKHPTTTKGPRTRTSPRITSGPRTTRRLRQSRPNPCRPDRYAQTQTEPIEPAEVEAGSLTPGEQSVPTLRPGHQRSRLSLCQPGSKWAAHAAKAAQFQELHRELAARHEYSVQPDGPSQR